MTEQADAQDILHQHLELAGDFETPTQAAWEEQVLKVLNRGRPAGKEITIEQAYKRLTHTSIDGIVTKPLYTKADEVTDLGYPGAAPYTRGATVRSGEMDAWDVCQFHEDPDVATTHQEINQDLATGATSIWVRLDPDAVQPADLKTVLQDVLLDLAPVHVSSLTDQAGAADALLNVFAESKVANDKVSGRLNIDPIGQSLLTGNKANLDGLSEWITKTADYPQVVPFSVGGDEFHNVGATSVQELAYSIASGIAYVRALADQGVDLNQAFKTLVFRLAATTDQFPTIAKFRALRLLWNHVGETLGVDAANRGAISHGITSLRQISRDDPFVNLLRGTIQTFGAAVGMAESITVLPFDTAHGLPTTFSRRMARNTQIILDEEANIGRVNDPAGGAYFAEDLTKQLALRAWELVQTIEAAGGMVAYLDAGSVASDVAASNAARNERLVTRQYGKTGVSEFPNYLEEPLERKARPAAPALNGLPRTRETAIFEALRDRSTAHASRPQVFMACMGTRRDFGGRETFTTSLLGIAGIKGVTHEGGSAAEIVEAYKAANTNVAILCSSKNVYAEQALEVASALKAAGASTVILAGNIKEIGADDTSVIDGTVAMGMDVVSFLSQTLDTLGVK